MEYFSVRSPKGSWKIFKNIKNSQNKFSYCIHWVKGEVGVNSICWQIFTPFTLLRSTFVIVDLKKDAPLLKI